MQSHFPEKKTFLAQLAFQVLEWFIPIICRTPWKPTPYLEQEAAVVKQAGPAELIANLDVAKTRGVAVAVAAFAEAAAGRPTVGKSPVAAAAGKEKELTRFF